MLITLSKEAFCRQDTSEIFECKQPLSGFLALKAIKPERGHLPA